MSINICDINKYSLITDYYLEDSAGNEVCVYYANGTQDMYYYDECSSSYKALEKVPEKKQTLKELLEKY